MLLALLVVFAGCASPPDDSEPGGDPGQAESPTTADNDAGAEPEVQPNETNNESGGTVQPEDGAGANESGGDESGLNETAEQAGANETGTNESGATETAEAGDESYQVAAGAVQFAAVGHGALSG